MTQREASQEAGNELEDLLIPQCQPILALAAYVHRPETRPVLDQGIVVEAVDNPQIAFDKGLEIGVRCWALLRW